MYSENYYFLHLFGLRADCSQVLRKHVTVWTTRTPQFLGPRKPPRWHGGAIHEMVVTNYSAPQKFHSVVFGVPITANSSKTKIERP